VNVELSLRIDSLIFAGTASHRRQINGSGALKAGTGPNIFAIDSFVNPNS